MPIGGGLAFMKYAQVGSSKTDFSNVTTYIGVLEASNTTAAKAYLQIFWKAAADVTLGTTVADAVIGLPASGGVVIAFPDQGWRTNTVWCVAGTTSATNSTEALIDVSVWRKL